MSYDWRLNRLGTAKRDSRNQKHDCTWNNSSGKGYLEKFASPTKPTCSIQSSKSIHNKWKWKLTGQGKRFTCFISHIRGGVLFGHRFWLTLIMNGKNIDRFTLVESSPIEIWDHWGGTVNWIIFFPNLKAKDNGHLQWQKDLWEACWCLSYCLTHHQGKTRVIVPDMVVVNTLQKNIVLTFGTKQLSLVAIVPSCATPWRASFPSATLPCFRSAA